MGKTQDSPPADNVEYVYTNECSARKDQSLCSDCSAGQKCFMSYPLGDSLKTKSADAACRCLPRQRAAEGYNFRNKNLGKTTSGDCDGCSECAMSVPDDDPRGWNSPEKMARCKPEPA